MINKEKYELHILQSTSHMKYTYKDLMNEKGCHSLLNFELQIEMENYEMFHI